MRASTSVSKSDLKNICVNSYLHPVETTSSEIFLATIMIASIKDDQILYISHDLTKVNDKKSLPSQLKDLVPGKLANLAMFDTELPL